MRMNNIYPVLRMRLHLGKNANYCCIDHPLCPAASGDPTYSGIIQQYWYVIPVPPDSKCEILIFGVCCVLIRTAPMTDTAVLRILYLPRFLKDM